MPDALAALETDRSKLLEEFLRLGDLRPVEQQHGGWMEQGKKRLLQSIRKLRGK